MVAQAPSPCMVDGCRNNAARWIILPTRMLGVCDDCWRFASDVRQLHLTTRKTK